MASISEAKQALIAEYSRWVAKDAIYVGNARAFNEGDPVPHTHVVRGVVKQSEVRAVEKPAVVEPVEVVKPVESVVEVKAAE